MYYTPNYFRMYLASHFTPRERVWSIAIEQLVPHTEYTVVQSIYTNENVSVNPRKVIAIIIMTSAVAQ